MAYIGQSLTEGTRRVYTYVATASQTTFNAVYGVGAVDVYQNGVLLSPADYTASDGTSVVLGTGAAYLDEISIVCHNTFSVADMLSLSGGILSGNLRAPLFDTDQNTTKTAIFQVNADTLTTDATIAANDNASANGPLTIDTGVTLTVNGTLTVI